LSSLSFRDGQNGMGGENYKQGNKNNSCCFLGQQTNKNEQYVVRSFKVLGKGQKLISGIPNNGPVDNLCKIIEKSKSQNAFKSYSQVLLGVRK
jgi:hypothetical protein